MKYREIINESLPLTEMPVGKLEVHHMDEPGTFPDADRRLLKNPKHIEKIRYKFRNVPWLFNLYFINQPGVEYTEKVRVKGGVRRQGEIGFSSAFLSDLDELNGERSADVIEDAFGIIMNRDPNAISVCYISNANEKYTVSMTPWIVAHRFGHALSDGRDSLDSSLEGLVAFGDKVPFDRASGPYDNIEIQKLMTMRSVRTDEILISDVQAELIAQYLMNGKVTLKRGTKIDNEVAEAEIIINKLLRQILNACVGKIFVTV